MISIENLHKSYGTHTLFNGIGFKINSKERVGLVGRNGHGKTTLFRIIIGEEDYDAGDVTMPKNYRIGHVRQHLEFTEDTILKEGMKGLLPAERDHHWKVERILAGLGFSESDMHRHPDEFSGGFQVRLNLVKVLVSEPDLLLLDEPTNYLDITSIRWIEQFLIAWPHELMLITHDRSFMDKVVTYVVGIHRKKARKIVGDTGKYYAQIAQDEEIYEKTRLNDERRQKEIEQFINRFRAKARLAGMVQSRIKTLEKMEKKNKLEQVRDLEFSFRSKPLKAKHVMSVSDLEFSYDPEKPLIRNLSFFVGNGDRVCVVGKNGRGKTTLLKLIAGALKPAGGEINFHPQVVKGFYEQTNVQSLVDSRTVEEEILYSADGVERQQARNICGAMMFEGDAALKKISVLSGGEKSRVILGKLLATPVNLLLLDEPTNHLDMASCDALLAAVDDFDGTVVMVTHNEMFLHALANRLVVFHNDRVFMFEGSYQRFLEKGGWEEAHDDIGAGPVAEPVEDSGVKLSKKEMRRQRSELIAQRARTLKPVEEAIGAAESAIEANEAKLEALNAEMVTASQAKEGSRIGALSRQIHDAQQIIDEKFKELERLYEELERTKQQFDPRIAAQD